MLIHQDIESIALANLQQNITFIKNVYGTLYHLNGTAYKVLSLDGEDKMDIFTIDADKGKYLLLATATWLPNPDNYLTTSGYVSYIFRVNVI
jgi:hypothetical protein